MASKAKTVAQKLHAVTQVKSCIGRPWWEKRTIKALGFSRLHQTIIHKNIPTVNGALRSVKHLLEIKPVEIVEEDPTEGQRNGQEGLFLRQNGHFHLNKFKTFLENNPDMKEMIHKRRKQAIWERRRKWTRIEGTIFSTCDLLSDRLRNKASFFVVSAILYMWRCH